jgi:hypothetical protein
MKNIKHSVFAALLALSISSSALAGDISAGKAKAGDISAGKAAGDISGGKVVDISGAILQVVLTIVSSR